MIDVIVAISPFTTLFGVLKFLVNMFMWLQDSSFNGSMCLMFVAFQSIFTWYIYVIENCLCNIMLLYSSTFVLCVQRIVIFASIS
jgi:hypothetical protein